MTDADWKVQQIGAWFSGTAENHTANSHFLPNPQGGTSGSKQWSSYKLWTYFTSRWLKYINCNRFLFRGEVSLVLPKWHCWHRVSLSNTVIVDNREWGPNPVPAGAWQVGPRLNKYIFRDLSSSLLEVCDLSAWRPRNLSKIAATTVTTTTTPWQKCNAAAFKWVRLDLGARLRCLIFSMWLYSDNLQTSVTISQWRHWIARFRSYSFVVFWFSDWR